MKFLLLLFSFVLLFANEHITIQLNWKYQFEFAGFIMAKEKGFYKDLGLDVTLREVDKNTNVVDFVEKHQFTYGVGDVSLIEDIMRGRKLELLMPIYASSAYVLTAVNLENIKTLKDIQKYHIVLDQFAIKNPAILGMLKSQGLRINSLNVSKENFYNNIHQKGVFAFYLSNEIYTLQKKHIPYKIFNPKDYGFDFYGDIFFTTKQEANSKRTQRVIEATKKGFRYAFNHINETINLILDKYNTQNLSRQKLEYEAKVLKSLLSRNFKFDDTKLRNIENIYILLDDVKNVDLNDFIYKNVKFTKKELEFIKSHIILGASTINWEPFNLLKNNKLEGIGIDYWNYIKNKAGISSRCLIIHNWSEVLEMIKKKEADMTCATSITKDREKYALFSKPYITFPIVIATRTNVGFISDVHFLKDKIIAVGKNYTSTKLLKQKYPYLHLLEVESIDKALQLVNHSKAYAAIDILPVIAYKINNCKYMKLKISGKTDLNFEVRFMVRNDYPELVSIINKVISSMNQEEKDRIYRKWISVKYQMGYSKNYIQNIYLWIALIIITFIALIFLLLKNIYKREEVEEELEELATIDRLTSVFNRYKIDMALNEQLEIAKRYKRPLSVIFFDIDHFKLVNDKFGHKKGDFVLIELAKVVTQNIRASDIFGRWGGEEFLIILPETPIEKAVHLAEKLRVIIENHNFGDLDKITCSFGVTTYDNDTAESIIERVDKLLYNAKNNGRNKVSVDEKHYDKKEE